MQYVRTDWAVEAFQWFSEMGPGNGVEFDQPCNCCVVRTRLGDMVVRNGDWVVTGPDGRQWVVEEDMFPLLYKSRGV